MSGRAFVLMGSGEFDPWAEPVDRWLLEHSRDGRALILPTASAPEGDDVFDMWAEKGLEHYRRIGEPAEVVPLKTREDAVRPEFVSALADASAVFFSGGNPASLAEILADTPFWKALLGELDRGLGYGGCSAGVACLPDLAPDSGITSLDDAIWKPGLRLFTKVVFMPHWDALDSFMPGLTDFVIRSVPEGCLLFAIDENTAVVGDGAAWSVMGAGSARTMLGGEWNEHVSGSSFTLALPQGTRAS